MNKPYIDFIVTHYNEPWNIGRKFFLMLSMQRNIDFDKINVIIVQDGEEGALDWKSIFESCPYNVSVVTIPHSGIAAARNAGIKNATADWIMFCDFDDMFSDVHSLAMILNNLPTNEADVLWFDVLREQFIHARSRFVNRIKEDFSSVCGKMFRTDWIVKNNITFPSMPAEYDYVFCSIALAILPPARIRKVTTDFTMYTKTLRTDSMNMDRSTLAKRIESIFYADVYVVDELEKRRIIPERNNYIAYTVFDSYFLLNSTPQIPDKNTILKLFTEFYNKYHSDFDNIRTSEMDVFDSGSMNKMTNIVVSLYNNFLIEAITPEVGISNVRKWLNSIQINNIESNTNKNINNSDERIAVYTGTKNTYDNILASLKSLYANSSVDHVYLLIEDDSFPHELPNNVTVMNIKDQQFFRKDGPNYKNSWTYMCLIRAAFPKLFPQHSKILSLDIDTVICDNIDDLWNIDVSNYYIAGVHENARPEHDYINFGIVLMNLDRMRRDHIDDQAIELLNTSKQQCPEQDAFNTICSGNILLIDSKYNYTPASHLTDEPEKEAIIHYAGIQYWKNFPAVRKYASLDWSEILQKQNGTKEGEHNV